MVCGRIEKRILALAVIALAFVMVAFLFVLSACGKSEPINADSGKKTEENVNDQNSDNSDDRDDSNNSSNAGDAENKQLGGVSFEIIDSDTVKALINDPYILARATDMMQIQLKLFPDEASIERHEGSFAFKMGFYAPNCITLNAYLGNVDDLTWDSAGEFTFYECDNTGARRKIEKEVSITDWR